MLVFFCTVEMASGRAAWCRNPDGMAGRFGATKPDGLPASRAWCLTARYPLFLRRRAPRRMGESEHGDGRRGASPPANPCFFVEGHHVGWANRSMGTNGVVPHRPLALVSSSPGTTPPISSNRTIPGTRPGFPEFPSPPKNENCRQGAAPATPCRHFPFPYQSVETVLFAH